MEIGTDVYKQNEKTGLRQHNHIQDKCKKTHTTGREVSRNEKFRPHLREAKYLLNLERVHLRKWRQR